MFCTYTLFCIDTKNCHLFISCIYIFYGLYILLFLYFVYRALLIKRWALLFLFFLAVAAGPQENGEEAG